MNSPDILHQALKSIIRKHLSIYLDYSFRDGYSLHPVQCDIKITNVCNLRCKMCSQWGEVGYNFSRSPQEIKDVVPLDIYKRFVDDLSSWKPWIYIWGGEPFMYPNFISLLHYMKQKGLVGTTVTNGTLLANYVEELINIGWDNLMFSIDGSCETHNKIRGFKVFDKIISSIKAIQEEKKKQSTTKPYIVILATVSKDNASVIDQVFDVCEDIHADLLLIYYAWFQTEENGLRHMAIMKEKLNTVPWSWKGYCWSFNQIDTNALMESVKRINSRKYSFPYMFVPMLKYEDIPRYYKEPNNFLGYKRCKAPWWYLEIMPNGDVVSCREYPDFVLGNIKNKSVLDIWNNARARKFRTVLKEEEGGLLPICTRCCGLMGY